MLSRKMLRNWIQENMFGLLVETFVAVSREELLKNVNLCLKYDMFRWKSRRWKVDMVSTLEDKLFIAFLRIVTSDFFSECI